MSVPTEVSEVAYIGNGASTSFPCPFPFHEPSHLIVTLTPSGGEPVLQTLGVDYSVSGAGGESGTVTFLSAPEAGETVTITREVPIVQDVAFRSHGTFSPKTHENALDYRTMVDQQLDRRLQVVEARGGGGSGGGPPLSTATPSSVHSSTGSVGSGLQAARSDHRHAHGALLGGDLHAVATTSSAGFLSATDKQKLDGIPSGGGRGLDLRKDGAPVASISILDIRGGGALLQEDDGTATLDIPGLAQAFAAKGATAERTLADRFAEMVNVKDFGALGNGEADDAAAIQAAIDAVSAAGGGVVNVPRGSYAIVGAYIRLKTGVRLVGAPGSIILHRTASMYEPCIDVSNASDVAIEGLTVDGQRSAWVGEPTEFRHCIRISNSALRVTLRDLRLLNAMGDGIEISKDNAEAQDPRDVRADNVWCDRNHRQGMSITALDGGVFTGCRFTNTSGTSPQAGVDIESDYDSAALNNIRFVGCTAKDNTGAGFEVWRMPNPSAEQGSIIFESCTAEGNSIGWNLWRAHNVTLSNCHGASNVNFGIDIQDGCRGVSVRGGVFRKNGARGINIVPTQGVFEDVLIEGATVRDNSATEPTTNAGILINVGLGDAVISGVSIKNCRVTGASQAYGISTAGGARVTHIQITGCDTRGNAFGGLSLADDVESRVSANNVGAA